jgi:glycosyltransferase involved in cell wall biosynthesis
MLNDERPIGCAVPPLRILMVAARYFPFMGGIESHVHEVGRRLVSRGHKVGILTADTSGALPVRESVEGMDVVRVPAWLPRSDFCLAPGLTTRLAQESWDVVHIQGYHTFSAPLGMLASIWNDVPFVLTFHSGGHSSRLRNRIRRLQCAILRPLVRHAARLIAVSRFEAEFFSKQMRIPRELFTVVPNGASLPKPTVKAQAKTQGPLIVSLGRLERYKGHHRVLEAFVVLRREFPGAKLRILGEGPYKDELIGLAARLKLVDSTVVGAIPPKERHTMANLLAGTDLVALFSEYEAHPVAVMEALSLGVPVLTSDTSGFREMAEKGLVRAISIGSSAEQIAQAMATSLRSARPAADISLPNWDDCTDQLLSIYDSARRGQSSTSKSISESPVSAPQGLAE